MVHFSAKYRHYILVAVFLLMGLSACQLFYSDAENRALDFVKVLVTKPEDKMAAMKYANVKTEAQLNRLLAPLPVQIALNYLRSSLKQDKKLEFDIESVKRSDPRHYEVRVKIRRGRSNYQRADIMFINVSLAKDNQLGWQVHRLRVPAR